MPVDFTAGILVMYTAAAARANITANEGITFFTLFPIIAKTGNGKCAQEREHVRQVCSVGQG